MKFRLDPCVDAFHVLDAYWEYKKWDRHIGLELLPHAKVRSGLPREGELTNRVFQGDEGKTNRKRWNLMFYRRKRDYNVPLRRFSDWERYKEHEADLQCKKLIEGLNLDISAWSVVAWVGHKGLFYNFSPGVVDGITQRMELAKARKAENAEKTVVTTPVGASSLPP